MCQVTTWLGGRQASLFILRRSICKILFVILFFYFYKLSKFHDLYILLSRNLLFHTLKNAILNSILFKVIHTARIPWVAFEFSKRICQSSSSINHLHVTVVDNHEQADYFAKFLPWWFSPSVWLGLVWLHHLPSALWTHHRSARQDGRGYARVIAV